MLLPPFALTDPRNGPSGDWVPQMGNPDWAVLAACPSHSATSADTWIKSGHTPGTPAPSPAAWPPLPAHTWALAVLTPVRYRLKAILIALNSVDKNTLSENQK